MSNNDLPIEEEKSFSFASKIDIHCIDLYASLANVVTIAAEHGFRAIVVPIARMEELSKYINKPDFGDKNIVPVAVFDYPYGLSTIDIRTYSFVSAKEKGAKEIEIVAPYNYIVDQNYSKISEDLKSLILASNRTGIKLRYVIDQNSELIDDEFRSKLYRAVMQAKLQEVSVSLGFFDTKVDHSENIIRMRNLKSRTNCKTKAYIDTKNPSDMALYPRAGADLIGLDWETAPYLMYEYQNIVQKKTS